MQSITTTDDQRSAHNQNLAKMVAGQEELYRLEIMEKIVNVAVVKDTRQLESFDHLNIQSSCTGNVIAMVRRFGAGFASMKEAQQRPPRFQGAVQAVDHGLHQRLRQIV